MPSPFAPLLAYVALQTLLPLHALYRSAVLADAAATAHATLHLLSAVALLPALYTTTRLARPPRLPLLAAFLSALVTLISAALRLLALPRAVPPRLPPLHLPLRLSLALAAALLLRASAPLTRVRPALPRPLRALVAARPRKRAPAPDVAPALLAALLHALADAAARAAEALARAVRAAPAHAAAADAVAALLAAAVALPVLALALRVLVQAAPARVAAEVRRRCDLLLKEEGVLRCAQVRFWEERVGVFVGTLCLVVRKGVETRPVIEKAVQAFDGVLHDVTVQVDAWRDDAAEAG